MIYVEVIPHKEQRYDTVGDWQFLEDNLHVRVSDTGDRLSNMLVAVHEIAEAMACEAKGVSQEEVDSFDMQFEEERDDESLEEPGDDPLAPYHVQHRIADIIERILALQCGVNWEEHCCRIEALG